jgi:hypothetical protein
MSSARCADHHVMQDVDARRSLKMTTSEDREFAWCVFPAAVSLQHHRTLLLRRPRAAAGGSCFRLLHMHLPCYLHALADAIDPAVLSENAPECHDLVPLQKGIDIREELSRPPSCQRLSRRLWTRGGAHSGW